jgi:hypothetical protein
VSARALQAAGLLLVGLLTVTGCDLSVRAEMDTGDPLAFLGSAEQDPRRDLTYWRGIRETNPELWAAAVDRCRELSADRYPNCLPVQVLTGLEEAARLSDYRADWNFRRGAAADSAATP